MRASADDRDFVTEPLATRIEALASDVPGFSPVDELFALAMLVYATADLPGDIVEVGSWHGRSAVVLGDAARATHGRVHCVDLFPSRDDWYRNADGTWSFRVRIGTQVYGAYEQQTVWADPFATHVAPRYAQQPDVFEEFLTNVRARGLDAVVVPHRGTSTSFVQSVSAAFRCRLLFLDGDHGYDAVQRDLDQLLPRLLPGGWLVFDDAFSGYEGVDRVIRERVLQSTAFDVRRQVTRKCFAARRTAGPR
ncbi:MAG: class I SAM-dependent methyltransferase [Vicinamibacterales bacterium]